MTSGSTKESPTRSSASYVCKNVSRLPSFATPTNYNLLFQNCSRCRLNQDEVMQQVTREQQSQTGNKRILDTIYGEFGQDSFSEQRTADGMPTLWVSRDRIINLLRFLKTAIQPRFEMLLDLTTIDERTRVNRQGQPAADFTVVYHLMSFAGNCDIRLKVALQESSLNLPTAISVWPSANWYEREIWDMFGITFDGHPTLFRILSPPTWHGHPLRKDHPARATEMDPYSLASDVQDYEQHAMKFRPEEWGMERQAEGNEFMFLNLGPNHP